MPSAHFATSQRQVVHYGIEYTGEVIDTPKWETSFGQELRGEAYFRIVLLRVAAQVAPEEL